MKYIKWITAVAGYFLLDSLWGAFFGLILGSFISFKLSGGLLGKISGFGNVGGISGFKTKSQNVFFKTVFTLMGKLAKADGRVSEQEIAHVEKFMNQLGMTTQHRKEAIGHFQTGSDNDFAIDPILQEFNIAAAQSPNLKQLVMVYLVGVAMADGKMHPDELKLLEEIAMKMGYSTQAFEQLLAMLQGQNQFHGGAYHQQSGGGDTNYTSPNALQAAYQALGANEKDSDAELKKSYRRLIREYHPDKLMGQGVPEDMIKVATERSQEIQAAYDLIKKNRGMK
ncbi:MAG TPA: co-chaperone DjlA [Leucothrix mucor]|nr:co-chaperone DjlA [Leucothrix mucor]